MPKIETVSLQYHFATGWTPDNTLTPGFPPEANLRTVIDEMGREGWAYTGPDPLRDFAHLFQRQVVVKTSMEKEVTTRLAALNVKYLGGEDLSPVEEACRQLLQDLYQNHRG